MVAVEQPGTSSLRGAIAHPGAVGGECTSAARPTPLSHPPAVLGGVRSAIAPPPNGELGRSSSPIAKETARESLDLALTRLAARQHGVFSRPQALAAGADDGLLHRRIRSGRLERVNVGVYRLPQTLPSFRQRLLVAVLGAGDGTIASHRSAATLLELDGVDEEVIEVSVPRNRRHEGVIVHRVGSMPAGDVTEMDAIPCTSATRTCVDLGSVVDEQVLERAFECAVRRGLTSHEYAARRAAWLARRGKTGPAALLRVLERRQRRSNDSDLETRFEQECRKAGISGLLRQVHIGPYVADFAEPRSRVVVELDGLASHGTAAALQRDLARQNYLVLEGWTILRFTWDDVSKRPDQVTAGVGRALAGLML